MATISRSCVVNSHELHAVAAHGGGGNAPLQLIESSGMKQLRATYTLLYSRIPNKSEFFSENSVYFTADGHRRKSTGFQLGTVC
jgi:hypothetical protein